jgi:preprotein translocase subunit SecE
MGTFVQPEMRRVSHTSKDENMPTIVKVLLLCVLCVGLITGIVYLVKWLS